MSKKYDSPEIEAIFNLTIKLSGIDPSTVKRSKSADRYWSFVEKLWKDSADKIGGNVMYIILFHIHWGCYPQGTPTNPDFCQLVKLAEAEFLKHTDEMGLAKSKQVFRSGYTAVLKSRSPYVTRKKCWQSLRYKEFLKNRTLFKLYGGQMVVENLNLVKTPLYIIEDMKNRAKIRYKYEKFKRTVIRLLPCAETWTVGDWANEQSIIGEMQKAFSINYADQWEDFDDLMEMLGEVEEKEPSMYRVLGVSTFTYDMAKRVWPTNTDATLEEMFLYYGTKYKQYASRAKGNSPYSYEESQDMRKCILDSWLYQVINEWNENETHMLSDETRKMLFDISLDIF